MRDAFDSYLTSGNEPEKPVRFILFSRLVYLASPLSSLLFSFLFIVLYFTRFTFSMRVRAVSRRNVGRSVKREEHM